MISSLGPQASRLQASRIMLLRDVAGETPAVPVKSTTSASRLLGMSEVRPIKVIRVIARLNVGGPAKHVVWLTSGLQDASYDSLLVAGSVPPGEEDMSYFAGKNGVGPLYIPAMSRGISFKDA